MESRNVIGAHSRASGHNQGVCALVDKPAVPVGIDRLASCELGGFLYLVTARRRVIPAEELQSIEVRSLLPLHHCAEGSGIYVWGMFRVPIDRGRRKGDGAVRVCLDGSLNRARCPFPAVGVKGNGIRCRFRFRRGFRVRHRRGGRGRRRGLLRPSRPNPGGCPAPGPSAQSRESRPGSASP